MNKPESNDAAERASGSLERMVRRHTSILPPISAELTGQWIDRYGPWILKQRPAGDWVVDQLDRKIMRVRRFGPYATEAEAREIYEELTRDA